MRSPVPAWETLVVRGLGGSVERTGDVAAARDADAKVLRIEPHRHWLSGVLAGLCSP